MAEEERNGVQNVWLLIIALALGLVVVVVYNFHIYRVRQEGRGKTISLLRVNRDIEAGERLADEDLQEQFLPKQYEGSLGNVVRAENKENAVGSVVNQNIEKGRWLHWSHIIGGDTAKPANVIAKGNVAVTVPVDPRMSLGDILSQNDRVNILGLVPVGQQLRTFRIIKGVRVLAIGGEGIRPNKVMEWTPKSKQGSRSYRSITIEVSPDVSIQLANVLTHVSGSCWVELLSSSEARSADFGKISPELKDKAASPSRATGSGAGGTPGGGGGGVVDDFE
ncbi:MAG TPA: Flp pilus assembly protein CpaB [Phycisphaerae bacterium]|nr:Flp pilus assembly protein CpaB [Phycisphaerae bacterium]HUU21822.1 Flp pilus assembly protein CpaB [Phycisphaerae bacterium]